MPYYGSCGWGVQFGIPQFQPKNFKGSSDPNHFIIEINVGKSRIRYTTTLYWVVLNDVVIFYVFDVNPWKSRNFSCLADNRLAQRNLCENNIGLIDDQFMLEDRERSCRIPCRGEYLNIDWTEWSLCQPINCRSEAMVRSAKRYRHKISFLPDKTFLEPKIEIQQRDCVTWSCFSYKQNRSGCFR